MIADVITRFFEDVTCPTCGDLTDNDEPRISFTHPDKPTERRDLEYRDNWEIITVEGIDDLADITLTTSNNPYSDGVQVRSSRRKERTVRIVLRVCPCEREDIHSIRRELYEIVDGEWDMTEPCLACCGADYEDCYGSAGCASDILCFSDYAIKDGRYLEMIIKCNGITRALSVLRNGSMTTTRQGDCYLFEFSFLAPSPNLYFPRLQSREVTLLEEDLLDCPDEICGCVCYDYLRGFQKCVTIPYIGNTQGWLKITVVGDVTDLAMTIPDTGASFDLNRNEGTYQLGGCGANVFNFMPGQKSFTDTSGDSVYQELATNCTNTFSLNGRTSICITGKQVNYDNFKIRFDWWEEFDGFFSTEDEPEDISACDIEELESGSCGNCADVDEDCCTDSSLGGCC